MSQIVQGSLSVKNVLSADRRVNQGLSKETIIAARPVTINDFAWLQIINAATQDVVMPDALTLSKGWSIVVMADAASGASVNAKSYHAVTPVLVKNILVGRAYRFTLLDNASAAGVWHIDFLEEADLLPAERYADSFNATSDWTVGSGVYTRTVATTTHEMGIQPIIEIFIGAAPAVRCAADLSVAANGGITISVPSDPDLRFAGKMVIL